MIEPKFDDLGYFEDGLAKVELDGKYGYIDTKGNFVIEPKFEEVEPFKYNSIKVKYNGKWGAIDRSGDWVVEPTHTKDTDFECPE